jgi:hypothetical protein
MDVVHNANHVKITDFGLAKLVGGGNEALKTESCRVSNAFFVF